MENYRHLSTVSSSVSVRPVASSVAQADASTSREPAIPVITVKENGKIRAYVQATLKHLQSATAGPASQPTPGLSRSVLIRGDGQAINKTVSVVEIVKRQFAESEIEQANELGCTKETVTYEPTVPRLDKLQSTRSVPYLAVTLTVSASSSSNSSSQVMT